jgi:hypothetical protein
MMNKFFLILALPLCVISCKKNKPTTEKSITAFDFKVSSNSDLITTDITCSIVGDSILLGLPSGVPITNLIPAISHTGKSVSPATNVAQRSDGDLTLSKTFMVK